jgi:lipopolysaccharide biosynthesis glycosyltransferase
VSGETLHIACTAEANYVAHSAAMLHSALARRDGLEVSIHYLHGEDISARATRRLARMVESNGGRIEFLRIPDRRLEGLPIQGFTRRATWYRIFLPELLQAERVLFLDSDTIVVDSLAPLWRTDLGDSCLGAVTNVWQWNDVGRELRLGLPEGSYFNAGVLLMDLARMRADGCSAELLDYGTRHATELSFRDQDALNVVLGERRMPLHPRWNCMNSILLFPSSVEVFGPDAVEEARSSPAIRHFEGPSQNKPWHLLCERGMRELYYDHRRQTPWPRVRPEGITPANLMRRLGRTVGA